MTIRGKGMQSFFVYENKQAGGGGKSLCIRDSDFQIVQFIFRSELNIWGLTPKDSQSRISQQNKK